MPGREGSPQGGSDGRERKNFRVVGYMAADTFAAHARKAVQ